MELKLNVYTNTGLREIEKTYVSNDFELSLGTCEDLLALINIDMFAGGLDALSDESKIIPILRTIVGGLPIFKNLLMDVFYGLTLDELRRVKTSEILLCVASIIKYSVTGLASSFSSKNI